MDFSDLALAKLLQTAPELGPMILNFSEINEDMGEDGDIKTGVFSLRIGSGYAFIPVSGRGDSLFPIDSVFIEDEGQFRPLTKNSISVLLNQMNMSPGKNTKIPSSVDKNPSVYNMINPPRTGKFAYASSSRLTEFLAILPNHIKQATFEKISSEKSVYDSLDKIFGLKTIFEVLKPTAHVVTHETDRTPSLSVVTAPDQMKSALTDAMAQDLIVQGYSIVGNPEFSRIAVAYQPFNSEGTYHEVSGDSDGGQDYNIVMKSGSAQAAYLPKAHRMNPVKGETLALFDNGNYATGLRFIAMGDNPNRAVVLDTLFAVNPPVLIKDCNRDDRIVMFTSSGEFLGPFEVRSAVLNNLGTELEVYTCGSGSSKANNQVRKICAYRNHALDVSQIGDVLYTPSNIIVLKLGQNQSSEIERSAHDASVRRELITSQYLGAELNLRYDGVEFSGNGHVYGNKANTIKALVEEEHIEPAMAENFLKQAELTKSVKIFLSKKASSSGFGAADVPQFGSLIDDHSQKVGLNGSFMPSIQEATRLDDGQVIEATIISQLLQVPDLFEYISEFLPELSEAVDKLGRILFLSRVKLDQLSKNMDPDSVFALVSQIKTVYRQLGDSVDKLREISTASKNFTPETDKTKVSVK